MDGADMKKGPCVPGEKIGDGSVPESFIFYPWQN